MCRCICWLCGLLALLIVSVVALGQPTQPSTRPGAPAADDGSGAAATGENRVEFVNEKYGVRLAFPDWLRKSDAKQPPGVALVLLRPRPDPGGSQAQILVVVPPDIRGGLGLDESARAYLEGFKRAFAELNVLETLNVTLDGEPAHAYVMQGTQIQGGRTMKLNMVIALRNDRLYSLIAMSEPAGFDTLKPTFDGIVDSFRWTK